MKRTIITLTVVLAAFVLGMLFGASKAQTLNSSVAIAAPAPVPMAVPMPNCPNIHSSIEGLRSTEQELRDAAHDFCGHKQAAMEAVHNAIGQLRAAEGCAKCR